jgi:hypothetical protein
MPFSSFSGASLFCCDVSIALSVGYACPQAIPFSGGLEWRSAVHLETEGNLKQRQIEFLNPIPKSDPQHRTIERALFNDRNEPGLILNRSVELDKVPALMRTVITPDGARVSRSGFNRSRLCPFHPPAQDGTARLNARTRDMT